MLLADMGAEVIKIETPGQGDPLRGQGFVRDGLSWYFAAFNRNKQSVTLNLRSDEGRAALARLIEKSDVLVENYRPGVLAAMGFDAARLKALNPGLVVCSLSGFGDSGPYRDRPSFDFIAQAMSGFMSVTGEVGGGPLRAGPHRQRPRDRLALRDVPHPGRRGRARPKPGAELPASRRRARPARAAGRPALRDQRSARPQPRGDECGDRDAVSYTHLRA